MNVFLVVARYPDGTSSVITAYKDQKKAQVLADKKTSEATDGTKYAVQHTPVNG